MTFQHTITWFEIPTSNINRAQKFYEEIFDMQMETLETPQLDMRIFPVPNKDEEHVSGALVYHKDFYTPSQKAGVLIYMNCNPDLQSVLDKVEESRGKVEIPKTMISSEHGYMAVILDTEGNRIGLHSKS
ncbi:MAG: VOC family protein [Crocinitomicaceae bacterium]|nr:VOC family protein [Crocinitomicaceae bacterium]